MTALDHRLDRHGIAREHRITPSTNRTPPLENAMPAQANHPTVTGKITREHGRRRGAANLGLQQTSTRVAS